MASLTTPKETSTQAALAPLLGRNQHEPDGVSAGVVAIDPANSLIHLAFELRKKSIAATHVN